MRLAALYSAQLHSTARGSASFPAQLARISHHYTWTLREDAMSSYVVAGLKIEECRAKNPDRCRYHVAPDGTRLTHYLDASSADAALKTAERALAGPRGGAHCAETGTGIDQASSDQVGLDVEELEPYDEAMFAPDDEPMASTVTEDVEVDESVLLALNKKRKQYAVAAATREVAAALTAAVRDAVSGRHEWSQRLAWSADPSPVQWPEWWSTRDELAGSGVRASYADCLQATARWSEDRYDADGSFASSVSEQTVGVYDAVRCGAVEWAALQSLGASSCWLRSEVVDGGSARPEAETAVAWCGRKPDAASAAGDGRTAACGTMAEAMRVLEELSVGWSQAIVEIHVDG